MWSRLAQQSCISCCLCCEPTMLSDVDEQLPEAVSIVDLVRQLGSQTSTGAALCGECSEQEASVQCEQCADSGPVCEPCFVALHPARSKAKKDHIPKPFTSPREALCVAHKKPLNHFCSHPNCWTALCDTCLAVHSSRPDAGVHTVAPLDKFAAQFLQQLVQAGHLATASAGVDTLVQTGRAWLDQARQAQLQAHQTQQLTSQQVVQLAQALHLKATVTRHMKTLAARYLNREC
jgi:hypothetical protein